jgi:signal peptidase I
MPKPKKVKKKKVKVTAGGEKHVVYKKTTKRGKGEPGDIMVNHPTKDKGKWDTINLTKIGRAKTVKEGVKSTKKWHKDNPDYKYKGKRNGK